MPDSPNSGNAPGDLNLHDLANHLRDSLRVRLGSVPIYVDLHGHLNAIARARHQVIFGRRGSGKSCLLLTHHDLCEGDANKHSTYFSADVIRRASYPDALAWLVISLLQSIAGLSEGGRKGRRAPLLEELRQMISEEDERDVVRETSERSLGAMGAKVEVAGQGVNLGSNQEQSITTKATFTRRKLDLLNRRIPDYSAAVAQALRSAQIETAYFALDDLYLLPRDTQPDVVDYLLRLLNGTGMHLKIGTVRHRTRLSRLDGGMFIGAELGQDLDVLTLDLTLETPSRTCDNLSDILDSFAKQIGMVEAGDRYIDDVAKRLLAFASGGVARDFLELLCRAIDQVGVGESTIRVEHVVRAVTDYWTLRKLPALRDETAPEEASKMEIIFGEMRRLCIQENHSPILGITRSDMVASRHVANLVLDLVDLKLLHLLNASAEVLNRTEEATVYLLDLSAFSPLEADLAADGLNDLLASSKVESISVSSLFTLTYADVLLQSLEAEDDSSTVVTTIQTPRQELQRPQRIASMPEPTGADPVDPPSTSPGPASPILDRGAIERLPRVRASRSQVFSVGGAEGYLIADLYEDGRLGEIRVAFGKQGSTLAGVLEGFSRMVSLGLQAGVPLASMVEQFQSTRFEPAGLTDDPDIRMAQSIFDYIFRRLALDHLDFETRSPMGIHTAEERVRQLETGSFAPTSAVSNEGAGG